MTQTFEIFAMQELDFQDRRYLENLERLKKMYEANGAENTGLAKRIEIIETIRTSEQSARRHGRTLKLNRTKYNL